MGWVGLDLNINGMGWVGRKSTHGRPTLDSMIEWKSHQRVYNVSRVRWLCVCVCVCVCGCAEMRSVSVWASLMCAVWAQFKTQFGETFSDWMSRHPRVYRVHQWIDVVEREAQIGRLLETSQRVLVRCLLATSLSLCVCLSVCLSLCLCLSVCLFATPC